jgi:ABC-type ATPase with predicted acetyltransferase domain
MFGLGCDEEKELVLFDDLGVKLGKGRIIYVTGDSGAGKTCLLKELQVAIHGDPAFVFVPPIDVCVGDGAELPLIDQFGDMGLEEIGALLAYVGIAEAFVYLRKPRELSDGQRYRFMLARLIHQAMSLSDDVQPVILVDEFLAMLDRETARNVAYQTRRVATKFGLCFVVATTHVDIAEDLQPNTTFTLRLNLEPEVQHKALAGR